MNLQGYEAEFLCKEFITIRYLNAVGLGFSTRCCHAYTDKLRYGLLLLASALSKGPKYCYCSKDKNSVSPNFRLFHMPITDTVMLT